MRTRHVTKNLFCVLLSVILCLSLVSPAVAIETAADAEIYESIAEAVTLEQQAADSLLSSYSAEDIRLGQSMAVYEIVEGQVVSSEAVYVPVFCGEDIVALAFVTVKNGIVIAVELAADLIPELTEYVEEDICLIFGKTDTYICYENQISILKSYAHMIDPELETEDAIALASAVEQEDDILSEARNHLSTKNLSGEYLLSSFDAVDISAATAQTARGSTASTISNLNALVIPQYGYNICWAATVASIGYHQTGVKKNAVTVATWLNPSDFNQGASIYEALLALQGIYDVDGVDTYYAPDFAMIKTEIYENEHPIYTRFWEGSGSDDYKHAVFIDGYMEYSSGSYIGRLSIGDPAIYDEEVYKYRTLYFTEDSVYPLTVNGVTTYANAHILLY